MAVTLVTGASGFIGSHLVERLLRQGGEVIGIDNFDPFYPRRVKEDNLHAAREQPGFHFVEADLRQAGQVRRVLEEYQPAQVVHLAAKAGVRPSIADPAAYVETNIAGTLNLLAACEGIPIQHFVFASSSSVYGEAAAVPFAEDGCTDRSESPYAATKKAGEALCFVYHRLLRMPVTCLRFFTVYGPRQRPDLAIHKFVRLIEEGKPIPFYGDGSTSRDYTYVDDTVDGVLAALRNPAGYEIYNLGNSHPVSLREMVRTIESKLGKHALLDRQPEQPGDVRLTYADTRKARERLGYAPAVSFDDGIERFVHWYRVTHCSG